MVGLDKAAMYSQTEQAQSGEQLVQKHAGLVRRIAQHLMAKMPASVQLDDLLQAGIIGLLDAARNFDAGKGAVFETYAGIRIRGSMIDEVRKGDWVPRSVHRNSRRISAAIAEIEARTGQDANDAAIAAELGVSLEQYYEMQQDSFSSRLFSYDEIAQDDDDGPGEQFVGDSEDPFQDTQQDLFKQQMAQEIGNLPERERLVLSLYYDEELSLKEIGLILEVSESRVSQIHSQATLRLRSRLNAWF